MIHHSKIRLWRPVARLLHGHVSDLLRNVRNSSTVSPALGPDEVATMLAKPTWSVKSLLDTTHQSSPPSAITKKQLHHLLRLSALPLPTSDQEEAKMIETLESQLHFVQAIQNVDTKGVQPLQSIRDETKEVESESEINVESLQEAFDKEEIVGPSRRIKRKLTDLSPDIKGAENWDPLASVPKKAGRYVVVNTGKG